MTEIEVDAQAPPATAETKTTPTSKKTVLRSYLLPLQWPHSHSEELPLSTEEFNLEEKVSPLQAAHLRILQSEELKEYIYKTSVYPREHEELKNIREATVNKYGLRSIASVPVDEGQFLTMLMKIMNPKKTLEIGVFTGYSLLATALGLADDAQVTAIDTDKEAYEVALPFIRNAGVDHKINFINSDAESVLTKMLDNNEGLEEIDFAFVDAEKHKYKEYHEPLLKLVKAGGIIAYDNTLFFGLVAQQENSVAEDLRRATNGILELNEFLATDPRIEISQISIGDGLTLCRRL